MEDFFVLVYRPRRQYVIGIVPSGVITTPNISIICHKFSNRYRALRYLWIKSQYYSINKSDFRIKHIKNDTKDN